MDKQIKELYQEIKEKKLTSTAAMQRINELRRMKTYSEDNKDTECEKIDFSEEKLINFDAALNYFKEILSSGIKLPAYKIDADAPMEKYGIDSIMVLNLTQKLEKVFGSLPKTLFFEYQTIGELTGYFIEKYCDKLGELLGVEVREKDAKMPEEQEKAVKILEAAVKTPKEPECHVKKERNQKERSYSSTPDFNKTMDIAIIGLSGKYPKANDLNQFWENLVDGKDCVTEIPKDRWDYNQYFDPDKNKEGKTCSKWGGFLDGVYNFDPLFFQISPREAEQMDPQERLFLECVYHTLEDAGYTKEACRQYKNYGLDGNVGVFVGVMYEEYQLYAAQEQARGNMISVYGNPASIANRVSYYFDFHGPCMALDTMCSSSLTAIHLAYQSLLNNECEMAIAGGVNISIHPNKYLLLGKNKFMSTKGMCESFGENGDGYVPGEGVGAVLLKPLDKAIEDGDMIYGVLKSTCINHGGKTNGFTVPNPNAQAQVMRRAYGQANMNPRLVSYIEAHGTGTSLGDPIEIAGLNKTFREYTKDSHFCKIGSVKSNIGHLESASGIASLTKVLLQMKYQKLVPSIHSKVLNPNIDFNDTPFVVQRELEDWNRPVINIDGEEKEYPRIAGISSFGAGGSNAHIVIEEYVKPSTIEDDQDVPFSKQLFVINAKNKKRLIENVQSLLQYVGKAIDDKANGAWFSDMAYTLQVAREAMAERLAIVASDFEELRNKLKQFVNEEEYIPNTYYNNVKAAVLKHVFEGQASTVFLKALMQGKELDKIGQLWVSGIEIDWKLLYQNETGYEPHRISLPGYSFAQEKYFPKLTQNEPIDIISIPTAKIKEQSKADYFYVPKWKLEENTSVSKIKENQSRNILIIYPDEAQDLCQAIKTSHSDDNVIKIKQGKIEQKIAKDFYEIDRTKKNAYQMPMEEVDSIDEVYYLGGIETRQKDLMNLTNLDEFKEQSVIGLLRFIKAFAKYGHIWNKTSLKIVTNHVYKVIDQDQLQPYAAGLFGLGKSIDKEFRSCQVTGIDVDYTGNEKSEELQQLIEMIQAENTSISLGTTAIRKGRRYVQKLYKLDLPVQEKTQFKDGGVYFILGGAGGIGLELCLYLAKQIHCKFVLVGRRNESDVPKNKLNEIQQLGSKVLYISADTTDEQSMLQAYKKAKEAFGRINGVIHSAIVLKDQALLNMEEETFSKVLDPKMKGSVVLYKVFKDEPLDFKLYFSSVQSFAGNPGQSNYAAGCTFKDAFASYEEENSNYSVKLVNWGYWGEVGVVANEEYNNRLKALGIYSLKTSDGMKAVESILHYDALQVLAIKADDSTMEKMGADFESKINDQEGILEQVLSYDKMPLMDVTSLNQLEDAFGEFRTFTQLLTLSIFQKAGIFLKANEQYEKQELFGSLEIIQKYKRLYEAMLDILESAGFIRKFGENQYISNESVESQEIQAQLSNLTEKKKEIINHSPAITSYVEFLWTCMSSCLEILRGEKAATEIIFPNSSMKLVEKVYRDNQLSDYMNEVVAWSVVSYINRRKDELVGNQKIKILEIGAGTGGTSSIVFPKLKPYQDIVSYDYTDISEAFMRYGKQTFGAENPYVNYKLFNVEKDPIAQAYESGTYDLVLATNVLHATKNIKNTIKNAKILLRKNGWIVMNELTKVEEFLTLTFGLLDGWWLYEDENIRLNNSPLLSNQLWAKVLKEEGYQNVKSFGQKKDAKYSLMQSIIVAESNGEMRVSKESSETDAMKQLEKTVKQEVKTQPVQATKETVAKKELNEDDMADAVEEAILASLSFALQIDKSELDIEVPYTEYGMDSILSGQVTNLINDKLNIELNSTVLFNYPNTAKLRDHILSSYKDNIVQLMDNEVHTNEQIESEIQEEVHVEAEPEEQTKPEQQYEAKMQYEPDLFVAATQVEDTKISNTGITEKDTKPNVNNDVPNGSMEIAIVGMSGVFPGAENLDEFWDNLAQGVDSITTIDRWNEKEYFDENPGVRNKSYINRSGLVRGMKEFDPLFFNISPKEAEFMDPQQRMFLEAAWGALEDAGYNDKYLDERKCGVFVGCMEDYYERLIEESGAEKSNYVFNGITIPILSARISYLLNLRGPSIVVSTACSSGLVALHLACESIINKTSEIAIAGGVNALPTPMFHILGSSTGMFSYTNEMRPFDNDADGFIPAEGCGAFVLKPLEKAKKDGDHIYGVIVGSGINQDGKSNGITAPSAPSQAALECEVYEKYNINPEQISFIEAHGTGTRLGDPIEIEALRESFSKFTDKKQFCAIGSVKSNIGHTLQAAGSASLAKVLLCMKHKKLVPSIHFKSENELIPFKDSPVYVNTEYKDWIPPEGAPRMAAISAFGISGTNCHVVVREYDEKEQKTSKKEEPYYLIALSAKTKEQLDKKVTDLKEWLRESNIDSLGNLANTLMIGRCHFGYRMALIVNSLQELSKKLEQAQMNQADESLLIGDFISNTFRADRKTKQSGQKLIDGMAQGLYTTNEYYEKLMDVAKLYVKGYLFDWSDLYNTAYYKKISMPTYPFSKEIYWIQNYNKNKELATIKSSRLHPLVGENTATLQEQKYTTLFSSDEFYIQGHQIEDKKVMPGVAYLEMARAAGTFAAQEEVKSIKDVILGSPITIKDTKEVSISLIPQDEDQVEFSVYTEDEDERIIHARGTLLYEDNQIEEYTDFLEIEEIKERCNTHLTGKDCYEMFESLGFHYDKNFQSIHAMYSNESEVLAHLQLPEGLSEDFDEFKIHPSIMDGALQAAIGLVKNHNDSSAIYLPFLIEKIDLIKPLTKECMVYVSSASKHLMQKSHGFMFHVTVTNMEGEVLAYVHKYVVREFSQKQVEQKIDKVLDIPEVESLSAWED